ncbi:LOW QUALITY PROTEIN: NADH-flavin oxidoreductase/NADH oxidase [Colletotrichum higginsianum IMI 349063]|uniref:NADH-flavin oxidoreductase/NADH oxidase n=1 Tax=Colletotrichum higginsianum (strain IMI 349063) TaxID=759273 RepID=A0A1B7Y4R1_COLHI|nr:LOW QUALITY PROTEIN: NADH-flavin oxidoreductase/NADH oxidase [Colletotrichum higginsianum IMI 349063]OBR07022.1 LOW QUALITY PROTEIN: NADH-flavin oxidoreductase/NADH oxidase [Colletotrichum higginsianum IMI 349063]
MGSTSPPRESRKLFSPLRLGEMNLEHRVVMSPLTRLRCPGGFPTSVVTEYYTQRATKGGLLITEGMHPSLMGGGYYGAPGMFAPEHVRAWKKVTDAVHAKGAFMACQLWHVGRAAVSISLGGRQPLSSSATNIGYFNRTTPGGYKVPNETARPMTLQDIKDTIDDHVHAAKCAIEAGFDCVEIVTLPRWRRRLESNETKASGNGYLLDQFLNSNVNLRTDAYGGTKENRARFTLEVLDAVIAAIGASRVSIRMSPWGTVWVPLDADPIANYRYVLSEVEKRGVAYVCLTQPQADLLLEEKTKWENMYTAIKLGKVAATVEDLHLGHFQEVLKTTPILASGSYDGENCFEEVERGEMDAITFGRWFISNPDLVAKLRLGKRLTNWNPATFYVSAGMFESDGYTDYPFGEVEDEEAAK